ncbi:MAG: DNA-binding protein [Alphaproteobacteria bacterium]|nr:MAG: DNA-binding protein [Alphaproteobacteria bacterium]
MSEREPQEEVLAFLADPATHGGAAVKRIDTHAAIIFLAGARVFKVKRAVRFPFLDYSTLDRRRQACEAELRINRPLAAKIYRDVVAITRGPEGGLSLNDAGTPVEWAVEMRRFDENATLDHLAAAGRIDADLADALGRAVVNAQEILGTKTAQSHPIAVEPARWVDALAEYIEEHAAAFGAPDLFPPSQVDALANASRAAHARLRALLKERGERGFIRRIHGDLHLGNIVMLDGRPVLFDAIEFSDLIASGDLLYDLAFLLMDLTERGLSPAACIVLNRYLLQTRRAEDLDALAALPFFLSMRAAIRAKVSAARLAYAAPSERPAIEATARKYFDFACRFIAPPAPVLVAVAGLSGTGKSVLARALAPALAPAPGAVVLRSDIERKALFGKDEAERLPEHAYAGPVAARVFATLGDKARRVLAAGHCAIVDAVFSKAHERVLMQQSAAVLGVDFLGLFLEADLATRLARVGRRGRDASDADAAIARAQESYDLGPIAWTRIDASGTPAETLARARAALHDIQDA